MLTVCVEASNPVIYLVAWETVHTIIIDSYTCVFMHKYAKATSFLVLL